MFSNYWVVPEPVLNIKTKEITALVKTSKNSIMLVLSVLMIVGAMLIGGCAGKNIPTQIIESITPQEALTLIQENQDNPDFVIIDVQTPGQFARGHIENAINLDYSSENFRDELDKLDKNKTYLIYCQTGTQSRSALDLMAEIGFTKVYKIGGGLVQWKQEGLATIQTQIIESITPQEAFDLIQENQDNPDFVIIDIQTPDKFAQEHIETAINLDYSSENFRDELDKLDKNKTYLIYCQNGAQSQSALDTMAELHFAEVYNISGGLDQWKTEGLATIQKPPQIIESIAPQEAFDLIQENQDNPDFVIIDIRTPEQFAQVHIENAINLYHASDNFQDELDKLAKDKTYLIYYNCACGGIDEKTLDLMAELGFTEVYNISGGLDQWKVEELPTVQEPPPQIIESITPQEAFDLTQENQDNPDFVIIDIRTPEEFAQWHVEDAINIDYRSSTFQYDLDQLDRDKTYLIYYSCACGNIDTKAQNMMAELGFKEVYKISGGLTQEKWEGLQP
jgi:rhodanese-related sulfurtransferase